MYLMYLALIATTRMLLLSHPSTIGSVRLLVLLSESRGHLLILCAGSHSYIHDPAAPYRQMDAALPHPIYTRFLGSHSGDTIHVQRIRPSVQASRL